MVPDPDDEDEQVLGDGILEPCAGAAPEGDINAEAAREDLEEETRDPVDILNGARGRETRDPVAIVAVLGETPAPEVRDEGPEDVDDTG